MGLIVLHSGHFSKIFRQLMGTPCSLASWRTAGERERLWVINRGHPIAQGIGARIELAKSEMYGEPFVVPEAAGNGLHLMVRGRLEVFRSGLTYQRGAGRVFYFAPGHTRPIRSTTTQPSTRCCATRCIGRSIRQLRGRMWRQGPNVPIDKAREGDRGDAFLDAP